MPLIALSAETWPLVVEALEGWGKPWPPELAALDLVWLLDQVTAGRRAKPPGRPFLMARWRMTDHQVRSVLAVASRPPADRQPTASAATVERQESAGFHQPTASGSPADRQRASKTPESRPPAPADRQPTASAATVERQESAGFHQPTASGVAPLLITTEVHTLTPSKSDPLVVGEVQEGTPQELGAEARKFLETYTRWASDPKAPKRWRTPAPEALTWFLTEILGEPSVVQGISVLGTLERWADWLDVRAEAHGKPGTAEGAKFPENWKNALRNWFTNARRFQPKAAPGPKHTPAGPRRGAYKGAQTTPLFAQQTKPPGDSDAFADWPDAN